jgi:hypothetical protein
VLVGELVVPQASLFGEGLDGELAIGMQRDTDE